MLLGFPIYDEIKVNVKKTALMCQNNVKEDFSQKSYWEVLANTGVTVTM